MGPVTPKAGVTQLVECDLAKVDVAGSNPVSRSISVPPKRQVVIAWQTESRPGDRSSFHAKSR
jgi:hypothetical protein